MSKRWHVPHVLPELERSVDRGNQSTFASTRGRFLRAKSRASPRICYVSPGTKITSVERRYKGPPFIGPRVSQRYETAATTMIARELCGSSVRAYIMGRPQIPGGSWKIRANRSFPAPQFTSKAKRRARE